MKLFTKTEKILLILEIIKYACGGTALVDVILKDANEWIPASLMIVAGVAGLIKDRIESKFKKQNG